MNIGDHVVCIRDTPPFLGREPLPPVHKGHGYVIRAMWHDEDVGDLVQLTGVPDCAVIGQACGYDPERFRLLEEIKEENRQMAEATA